MTRPTQSEEARPAVAYVRRSTDRQDQSISGQRRAIASYAAAQGFEIAEWYEDDAISGASVETREAFQQMLADAMSPDRRWRTILVYDVSRFSRGDIDEAGHLRYQLRKAGVEVVYCNENLNGDDSDDLILGVKQWQARQYVKDLSRHTIRGQVSHAEAGRWPGGVPPYGYDLLYHDSNGEPYQQLRWMANGDKEVYDVTGKLVRVVPRGDRLSTDKSNYATLILSAPERVEIIRRIFRESVEEGRGYRTIADGLNRDAIPSPRDGKWSRNTQAKWSVGSIRAILRNPAYRGDTVWNRRTFAKFHKVQGGVAVARDRMDADKPRENHESDWIVVPSTHEPIIPLSMFDRAQELTKPRGRNAGPKSFRGGSGMRSPYLLTGLLACGRCGQNYQGRTVNSTKKRKDGTKIKTLYYCCGGHVMKGNAVCKRFLLRKQPLEEFLLDEIGTRVKALLNGEGETLLREFIAEEIATQGQDPRYETVQIRARLAEIDNKASVLLDGMSDATRGFVNDKLRDLADEKRRLQRRLDELAAIPYEPIDAEQVLGDGMTALQKLPALMESASLEERKEFVNAFVASITVHPDEQRLDIQMRKIPAMALPQPGNSSVGLVAGAGSEPATSSYPTVFGSPRLRIRCSSSS